MRENPVRKRLIIGLVALLTGCVNIAIDDLAPSAQIELPQNGQSNLVSFESLFAEDTEGHFISKYPLKIGAVQLGEGIRIGSFVTISGTQIEALQGTQFNVINHDGVLEIIQ
ncbi:hypothetical protein PSSHI_14470 [Photobacterium sp. R1]